MATRRNRIKGIANIPQRRKADNKPTETSSTFAEPEPTKTEATLNNNKNVTEIASEFVPENLSLQEPEPKPPEEANPKLENTTNEKIVAKSSVESSTVTKPSVEFSRRRTFIKPIVNPKLLSQRPKLKLETVNQEVAKSEVTLASDISVDNASSILQDSLNRQNDSLSVPHHTLPIKATPTVSSECVKSGSDNEYSVGPLSPTKLINRSRIKAVPRLGQRRTSMTLHGSASESEDDGRKNYKRIRTESACSTASVTNEPPVKTDMGSPQKSKEFSSIIQRKCKRTEQSRKMAEARRHFIHKFGNQTPDKQKLTMIDLIFYNPTTNPMCQKPKKQSIEEVGDDEDLENTEIKDEVKQSQNMHIESDEENAIPAPQIKIGANGEIVVDEKSLIIENIETKRGREELQKSKIVDGDFDTGYGVYKREKRSKDWSKDETLRFYKALNTLGTDFTLMVELFSGRSRRELKMKFKKEERVNRLLVDKALTQPVQFDITELRKEVVEKQKRLEEETARRSLKSSTKNLIPYFGQGKTATLHKKKQNKNDRGQSKPSDMYSKLEKGIASIWESESEDENSDVPCSKPYALLKPTRSGRIPKPTKPYDPKDVVKKQKKELDHTKDILQNSIKDLSALQPGSVMIVSSQTPTGEPTFKVFMVTPTQNKVPITLAPDMLTNLTQSTQNPNIENAPEECNVTIPAEEYNITSPAEENVTVSTVEQDMWPYEHNNVSVPVANDIVLPEDKNTILSSDGKYDVELAGETSDNVVLPH